MKLHAFKMKLKLGFIEEYKKRHDEIWPELKQLLSESGILEYSIWLDEETHILFAIQKLADNADTASLPEQPIMQKWWKYMAPLMDTTDDFSPATKDLKKMFIQ